MKEKKQIKWRIELTEHQLRLIANCVEDCFRFIGGHMKLSNSTACLEYCRTLREKLAGLQSFVTPQLMRGASYGWDGRNCSNENQRKFLAETYYLYREIYHQMALEDSKHKDMGWNVYLDDTLTCKESGEPIKLKKVEKFTN